MAKLQDLIEWDYLGSHFSVYIKHFTDDDGKRGMKRDAVNGGAEPYRGIF